MICFPLASAGAFPAADIDLTRAPSLAGKDGTEQQSRPQTLEAELAEEFFRELWVPRHEVDRIVANLVEKRSLVVLTGDKGSGKTTVVRHIFANLNQYVPDKAGIIVDVQALDHLLQIQRPTGKMDLCSTVYEALVDRLIHDDMSIARLWNSFLLDSDPHFSALRSLPVPDALTRFDYVSERRGSDYEDALLRFHHADGIHKLATLLRFVRDQDGCERLLFLDNVDRYSSGFQVSVARHLHDLLSQDAAFAAVVTLRPGNYNRIKRVLGGIDFVRHVQLDPLYGDELTTPVDMADVGMARNGSGFFVEFLQRRLSFLSGRLELVADADAAEAEANLRKYQSLVTRITAFSHAVDSYADLTNWYNGSARATAYSFMGLLRGVLIEEGPLWRSEGGSPITPAQVAFDRRLVRTLAYRHIILEDDGRPLEPSAPMLYTDDFPTYAGHGQAPFLELHLLHFLLDGLDRTVDEIREHAASVLGAPSDRVDRALQRLWEGRGVDETGLIHIDDASTRAFRLRRSAEVSVLRSGRFMTRILACSCEYLFWSALFHGKPQRFLPPHTDLGVVHDEGARLQTAVRFFDLWIKREMQRFRSSTQSDSPAMFQRYVGTYPVGFLEDPIRSSLRVFAERAQLHRDDVREAMKIINSR